MKTLKILLGIVAVLVVALLIIAAIAPKSATVERTITVNAPAEMVMKEVNSLEQMQNWSPWAEKDPEMKVTYEGNMGSVGSISRWEGNKDVGKGEQSITAVDANKVETHLIIYMPFGKSESDVFILAEEEAEVTKVTWHLTNYSPFPFNVISIFMNLDDAIGPDFEKGLNKLKTIVETKAAQEPAYTIEVVEMPAKIYIAKKDTIEWSKISEYYATYLPQLYEATGKNKLTSAGAPTGLYYLWDEENQKTVMAAAIPVTGDEKTKVEGYETIVLPSGRALKLVYFGAYDQSEKAHMAMDKYMKENSMQQTGPVIEEYITDPANEPDTSKWQTIIYYPVQ